MINSKNGPGRRRPGKNVFTTKSGRTIKLNRSLGDKFRASRDAKARKRAAYLSTLPKNRFKRVLYMMHPKRVAQYWFSREGGIMALKITGVALVVGFILLVGVFAYFRKDLPNIKDISGDELGGSISYYDRTGQTVLWQDYDAVKRVPVSGENISGNLKQATIAIEDKDFYKHGAFDVSGIVRAGLNDVFGSGGRQGGSTITQQLVKLNQNWTNDRTLTRKVKELILAVELEREYSKQDILTGYLNIAPYGNVQYGAETASRDYFNISAKELSLSQAAFLAAIPKAPSIYSPYGPSYDPDELLGRQQYILDQMADQKMISKQQAEEAKKVDILAQVRPPQPNKYNGIKAPYFVLAAKQELEERFGASTVQRGGWRVTTTVDMNLQNLAEQQVAKGAIQVQRQGGDNIAFAAEDVKTGQMVALVGGVDFSNPEYGQLNYATRRLPPGSSFKPYDYAALINESNNVGAGSVLYDTQGPLEGYPCTNKELPPPKGRGNCLANYDFRYPGPLTLRYALGGSRNVPAVKAMLTVGVNKTIGIAESLGLKSGYNCYYDENLTQEAPCYGSAAIGDGAYLRLDEHVNGYASLSRMGQYIDKTYILKITDGKGKDIEVWKQPKPKQAIKPDAAYIVLNMLADPNASYLPGSYKAHRYKGWHFGFKTGTTNDAKDGWMMGVSSRYAVGVWVGYHSRQKVLRGSMETMTQPIVKGWMNGAHDALNTTPVNWTPPAGIKTLPAYIVRNHVGIGSVEPSPATDIYPSWYQAPKQANTNQVLDIVSNKLATSCTPERAKKNSGGANDNAFSVDIFVGGRPGGGSATASDDIHNCNDVKPSITLTAPNTCGKAGEPCEFTVTITQGTHALHSDKFPGTINLKINGQQVQSQGVAASPTTHTFKYIPTAAGTATIEAEVVDSVLYSASSASTVTFELEEDD